MLLLLLLIIFQITKMKGGCELVYIFKHSHQQSSPSHHTKYS